MPETRGDPPPCDDAGRAKRELRRRVQAARDAEPAAKRGRLSVAICARAAGLPELAAASTLLFFASFRSEVDTAQLIAWALEQGKAACLPRVLGPQKMTAVASRVPRPTLYPARGASRSPGRASPRSPPKRWTR